MYRRRWINGCAALRIWCHLVDRFVWRRRLRAAVGGHLYIASLGPDSQVVRWDFQVREAGPLLYETTRTQPRRDQRADHCALQQ